MASENDPLQHPSTSFIQKPEPVKPKKKVVEEEPIEIIDSENEDEKQYKGSWRLAYPTKEIVTKNMLWTNSEWLPGHHNKLLHDYILFDGNHH